MKGGVPGVGTGRVDPHGNLRLAFMSQGGSKGRHETRQRVVINHDPNRQ
jgi:hypothetical protein